ncbi:MAG: hypothetical protein WBL21_06300 [Salinimicrobium sp.]
MRNLYLIAFLLLFNSCGRDQKKQGIPAEVKQELEVVERDTAGIPELLKYINLRKMRKYPPL